MREFAPVGQNENRKQQSDLVAKSRSALAAFCHGVWENAVAKREACGFRAHFATETNYFPHSTCKYDARTHFAAMSQLKQKFPLWFIGLFSVVWISDLLSKLWVIKNILPHTPPKEILGSILRFTYTENTGGVFGIFQGNPLLFQLMTGAAIIFLVVYYYRVEESSRIFQAAIASILGGACGNFTDRFYKLGVVDFIDLGFGDFRWWIFNIADAFISVGAILLAIAFYQMEKAAKRQAETASTKQPS